MPLRIEVVHNTLDVVALVRIQEGHHCLECGKELTIKQKKGKNIFCSSECARKGKSKDENMKQKCKENALERIKNGTHNGWNTRNIISYPEQFFIKVLQNNNIKYEFNYKVKHSDLNNFDGKSYYFLDFFIKEKFIDLEIDGKQHEKRKEHDLIRDNILTENNYNVYRIKWKSINSLEGKLYIENEINKFLNYYNNLNKNG